MAESTTSDEPGRTSGGDATPEPFDRDEKVKLNLTPEVALRALLQTPPENGSDDEPSGSVPNEDVPEHEAPTT